MNRLLHKLKPKPKNPGRPISIAHAGRRRRVAVIKGQDLGRWTDFYHFVLTVPWSVFFLGVALFFGMVNVVFALFYMADPNGILHARPHNFWDAFLFSVQTIGSINYSVMSPKTIYANTIVVAEAFFGILNLAPHRMVRLLDHNNGLCAFRAMRRHEVCTNHNAATRRNFEEG